MRNIHFISVSIPEFISDERIVLRSKPIKVFQPHFILGCVFFVAGMFVRSQFESRLSAIPLGVASILLITAVWKIPAIGKIIADKKTEKIYLIYRHLGYIQKLVTISFSAVAGIELREADKKVFLEIKKEDGTTTLVAESDSREELTEAQQALTGITS